MKRLSAIIIATAVAMAGAIPQLYAQTRRPNIVVIMTDDQALESMRVMPRTRTLIGGANGTRFRNSYVALPWCCPSRATFLTGQYPHNHNVWTNGPPDGGYSRLDHSNTLPVWLRRAGYYTAHIGKYLNGYSESKPSPPGWSDWQAVGNGPYSLYNYAIRDNSRIVNYGSAPADYQTDVLSSRARTTLLEMKTKQPFFLSIAPKAPHVGAVPAPRHATVFSNEPFTPPANFNEANVSDKPKFIQGLPLLTSADASAITQRYRKELGSLLAVDELVARVVNVLSTNGMLSNTVIIFTSDHGVFHGEHRIKAGKVHVYEEAVETPLLIRGPGFPAGKTVDQFVSNIDLAPTIVALAGAAPGLPMDGVSLLPLVQDPTVLANRNLLIETLDYQAVRNRSFLYVERDTGEQELYDMRVGTANYDPYQMQSRHADPAYTQEKETLSRVLNLMSVCMGTSTCTR
jgi:arylsulfatase A-like enzyme